MAQHKKKIWCSINMSDPKQNEIKNEIKQIKRELTLLQDNLKRSKKPQNLLQNAQKQIAKMQTKKRQNGSKRIEKMKNL